MVLPKAARVALALIALVAAQGSALSQSRYALIVGGLGGAEDQTARIETHLEGAYNALAGPLAFSEVTVLAERALAERSFVSGESTAENIRGWFASLANVATAQDEVYVLLFGHGSYDGTQAALNIPRRDLIDSEYAELSDALNVHRTVWICTMSASGPFVQALSAPNRIIITATRTGSQRNQTVFPQFFVESLVAPSADLDRDGSLSVREVFQYTAERTATHYNESGHLATEHSLLEDTGDGEGVRVEALDEGTEGHLAGITYLQRGAALLAADDELAQQRSRLEGRIAEVKARKQDMSDVDYYSELEMLFVALARLNDRIEAQLE